MKGNETAILIFAVFLLMKVSASPECDSWEKIKKYLKDELSVRNCTIVDDCTGIFCYGHFQTYDVYVKAEVNPCAEPVSIDFTLDIPKTNVRNVTHSFRDGNVYEIPDISGFALHLLVNISLKENDRSVNVRLSLKSRDSTIFKTPIISNGVIVRAKCKQTLQKADGVSSTAHPKSVTSITDTPAKLPAPEIINTNSCTECGENEVCLPAATGISRCSCKDGFVRNEQNECYLARQGQKCNIHEQGQCDAGEICVQTGPFNNTGTCECAEHFHVNTTHHCIPDHPGSQNVGLILGIVLPISFLLLCAAFVFVAIKQRLIHRIRERFINVRTYEVVAIGNDDDDEPLVA